MKKGAAPAGGVPETELRGALRETIVRLDRPFSVAELRKALPKPYQRPAAEITRVLDALVRDQGLFSFRQGTTSRYTRHDPRETVAQAVLRALGGGPLTTKELSTRVKKAAPGLEKLLPAALAELRARGAVHEHPKADTKHPARVGLEPPDPTPFLAKAFKEIQAVQKKLAPHGVTPDAVLAALRRALGGEGTTNRAAEDEAVVLVALSELAAREPPGTLLSVRALRARRSLPKARFDSAVLRLSRAGRVVLHHHDFPASLPEAERAELVQDDHGVHYIGIAQAEGL